MDANIKSLAISVLRRHALASSQSHPRATVETRMGLPETGAAKAARCGSPKCAGCYSVGVIDGRERFIHPPKASEGWGEWFRKWDPKGERPQ